MSRITLKQLYPDSLKLVHTLPAIAVIIGVVLLLLGIFVSPWWLLPLGIYAVVLFLAAMVSTRSLGVSLRAIPAAAIQITGYGTGFIRAYVTDILLGAPRYKPRDCHAQRQMTIIPTLPLSCHQKKLPPTIPCICA